MRRAEMRRAVQVALCVDSITQKYKDLNKESQYYLSQEAIREIGKDAVGRKTRELNRKTNT
jgi:hypothetical protein